MSRRDARRNAALVGAVLVLLLALLPVLPDYYVLTATRMMVLALFAIGFNTLLGTVHSGTQLIVVDACFSGGLAKDIISHPGRMGMFSSEEDVTSAVAAKFRAGGYLSVFFFDSLMEPYADADEDGRLCALEISHYISERYRAQVKGPQDWVSTSQNLGYQKLVVDRGSIGPYDTVFLRRQ